MYPVLRRLRHSSSGRADPERPLRVDLRRLREELERRCVRAIGDAVSWGGALAVGVLHFRPARGPSGHQKPQTVTGADHVPDPQVNRSTQPSVGARYTQDMFSGAQLVRDTGGFGGQPALEQEPSVHLGTPAA